MDSANGPRLVRLERYLAGVPDGLDGHATAQAKGSLVRNTIETLPLPEIVPFLPERVRRLATDPPMAGEWIPEVHFVALFLSIADIRGLDDAEVWTWARERNRVLFQSAAYRLLMSVSSPGSLIRYAGLRWSNWHRGSRLEVEGVADDGVRFSLAFPEGLFEAVMVRVFAEAFGAALEMAHTPTPEIVVLGEGRGFARYLARW